MTCAALEIRSLSLTLQGTNILENVSACIEQGETWSVIGANGAGKSSLLKCLMRIQPRWTGRVRLFGRDLREYSQRRLARKLVYVPQPGGDQRFPFTVRQFVAMGRYAYSGIFGTARREDETVVRKAMERADVTAFADRMLETLSGGERQKVFIAAALAQEGEVMLLDEPTAFLDYRHRTEVSRLLREINRSGVTILSVTHDVNSAILHGGRVLALKQGRPVWSGSVEDLSRPGRLEELFDTPFRRIHDPASGRRLVIPRELQE